MKILLLIDDLCLGGAQTHVLTLARGLCARGHEVWVASDGGVLEEECRGCGVRTLRFVHPVRAPSLPLYLPRLVCWLLRRQRSTGFDVLHAHTRRCAFLLSLCRPFLPSLTPVGAYAQAPYRRRSLRRALAPARIVTAHARFRPFPRRLCDWGERTIAVSQDLKEHLVRRFGVTPESVCVIPNGIEVDLLRRRPNERDASVFHVAFASRLDGDCSQGAFALLAVVPALKALCQDAGRRLRITLLGGGQCLEALSEQAAQVNRLCGEETVRVVGAVRCPPDYFQTADVFVGVSRAALEAAGCGCAVVLGGNEGFGGVLNADNYADRASENFCCRSGEPLTPRALLSSLTELLHTSPRRLHEQVVAVQRLLEQTLSLDKTVARTLEVYRHTLKRRRLISLLVDRKSVV